MVTEEQIEKAAEKYADEYYSLDLGKDREETNREIFARGAHWAIDEFLKGLWHDVSEEPEMNKSLLVQTKITGFITMKREKYCGWNLAAYNYGITRWLYIDELTKKGGSDEGV